MTPFKFSKHANFNVYPKYGQSFEEFVDGYVAYDVIFLPSEMSVAPDGVKYILSDGHAVLIHPVVYAHYLRFIMFHKQGSREKSLEHIGTFSTLIQELKVGAVSVGHALLGQCYFLSGDYQKAGESFLLGAENGNKKMSNIWQLTVLLFHMWKT